MIRNDICVPRISSRMVARICDLQRKQKHHHKAKSVLPRAVPFWASAKTISVRDICGESVAAERDDDQDTVEDFEEPVADEYTVSKSKYSILGQLEEWDLSKLKSEYSNHEAEMYSKLSGRLSRATKFDVAVQKIVPSRIIRDPRPPLLNSKYIVPSSKKTRTICTDKMKKRDSAATLAELEVYIEQSGAGNYMGKELDNEIEDGLGQTHADEEYRNAAEQFIGKRSVLFARVWLIISILTC